MVFGDWTSCAEYLVGSAWRGLNCQIVVYGNCRMTARQIEKYLQRASIPVSRPIVIDKTLYFRIKKEHFGLVQSKLAAFGAKVERA